MTYWCIACGEMSSYEICPECEGITEELKSGLKSKRTMVNIDDQLKKIEDQQLRQAEIFKTMFGEHFHIRGKK